nr:hypothetical protein [Anaerolineae bacterium]
MTVCFEDVTVGDDVPKLDKGPIMDIELVRYAGAVGDFNPIHTVPKVAQFVGLEGIIAHGMMIMAYAGQMLTAWAGPNSMRRFKARFSGMTRPGEAVVCQASVLELFEEDGEARASGRFTVKGKDDASLKLKGEFTVALPRRSR